MPGSSNEELVFMCLWLSSTILSSGSLVSSCLYKYDCEKKLYYCSTQIFLVRYIFLIILKCSFHGMSLFSIPHAVQPWEAEWHSGGSGRRTRNRDKSCRQVVASKVVLCAKHNLHFFKTSITQKHIENAMVTYFADYLNYYFEDATKIMSFLMHRKRKL